MVLAEVLADVFQTEFTVTSHNGQPLAVYYR